MTSKRVKSPDNAVQFTRPVSGNVNAPSPLSHGVMLKESREYQGSRLGSSRRVALIAAAIARLLPAARTLAQLLVSGLLERVCLTSVFSHCSGGARGRHFSGLYVLLFYSVEAGRWGMNMKAARKDRWVSFGYIFILRY